MARVRESTFWKRVRRAWPGHALRIEASHGEVEVGTPDVVLSIGGHGGYVELKVWPEPLQPMQLPWHLDALSRGASCWVLCDLGDEVLLESAAQYDHRLGCGLGRPHGITLQQALNMIQSCLVSNSIQAGSRGARKKSR